MIQDTTHVVQAASTFPWQGLIQTLITAAIAFLGTYFGAKHGVVSGAVAAPTAVASKQAKSGF
jgi:hypothetical protein